MSWTDEELDSLVNEAANAKKIAYKDAYWHEMEAMLGTTPSGKSVGWWWFSGIAILAITIGATVMASSNSDAFQINKNVLTSSNDFIDGNVTNSSKVSTDSPEHTASSLINNNSESNQFENSSAKKVSSKLKTINNKLTSTRSSSSSMTPSLIKTMQSTEVMNNQGNLIVIDNSQPLVLAPGINSFASSQLVNQGDANSNELIQNLSVSELTPKSWSYPLATTFDKTNSNLRYLASKRFGFYAGLYSGVGQSYVTTDSKNSMLQLGVKGGVEFFVKKWSFGVGLGYRQQFVQNLEINSRKQYYTFGLMNINQNLEYDQLLFSDLNLNANYSFGRSELGIQASPSYVLGARMSFTEDREEILGESSIITTMPSKNNQFVTSANFKSFSMNVGLNYSYAIRKNTLLNLNVNTRLGGSLLNNSFDGNQRKAPMMLEVGLKKRF